MELKYDTYFSISSLNLVSKVTGAEASGTKCFLASRAARLLGKEDEAELDEEATGPLEEAALVPGEVVSAPADRFNVGGFDIGGSTPVEVEGTASSTLTVGASPAPIKS